MSPDSDLDLKRIQALTDATFAVAMTILILEVRIPAGLDTLALHEYFFRHNMHQVSTYVIGFVTMGIFWIGSHFHHHHLLKTDRISSWMNILFLMLICLIPFTIGFVNNYRHEKLSLIVYSINLILASAANYGMLWYAWKKQFVKIHFTRKHFNHGRQRIMIPICIYAAIIPVAYLSTEVALYMFLVPIVLHIIPETGNKQEDDQPGH
jgi:uncharacterized membrane protein